MIWALHGAVGMAADWRGPAKFFPDSLDEIRRIDLWRYLDCCPMSLEKTGAAIATEISRVDPNPILLGYSMGARIAMHAMLAMPDLWQAAIIISAHPGLSDDREKHTRRKQDAEWSALALKADWQSFLDQWQSQSVLSSDANLPDRTALKARRASIARSFVDWSLGTQKNLTPSLANITCPQLWLTGVRDEKFTALAAAATEEIPSAKHQVISNCGHRLPWENPGQFANHCSCFLKDNT